MEIRLKPGAVTDALALGTSTIFVHSRERELWNGRRRSGRKKVMAMFQKKENENEINTRKSIFKIPKDFYHQVLRFLLQGSWAVKEFATYFDLL